MTEIENLLQDRYTTKVFDPQRTISPEKIQQIKNLLRFSASSVNIQPWHFVLAASEAGKARIANSVAGSYGFNEQKIRDASHVVVLCTRVGIGQQYLQELIEQQERDGRFLQLEDKQNTLDATALFSGLHFNELKDGQHWLEKQVYLALGNLLLGAKMLGIDTCPMEGFDAFQLNSDLALRDRGLCASVIVALGYQAAGDYNAKLPKSRWSQERVFTEI